MEQGDPSYRIVRVRDPDAGRLDEVRRLRDALMVHHNTRNSSEPFMRFIVKRLKDETMLLILALADETPIGYALAFDVAEHPFMPEWQRSGYIAQFFVAPDHRRRGVGDRLLQDVEDWFVSRGITKVMLNVSVDNPVGDRFWRRHGFVPQAIRMKRMQTRAG